LCDGCGSCRSGHAPLAQPAEAKIIYTQTHHVVGPNSIYNLDLNHDGVTDFALFRGSSCDINGCESYLDAAYRSVGNGIEVKGSFDLAGAMPQGAAIGPRRNFDTCCFALLAAVYSAVSREGRHVRGHWVNVKNHYLGLMFHISGETHFGWARLDVTVMGSD